MVAQVKEAAGTMSDAFETACGSGFCAVALYAMLFVNLTGNGTLWDSMRGIVADAAPVPIPTNAAVPVRAAPVRPPDEAAKAQDRMLVAPSVPDQEFSEPVPVPEPPARAVERITDAPAETAAGKKWQRQLTGSLRTLTVYGQGEERSYASASSSSVQVASLVHAATPATAVSAYHAGISAEVRPGVVDYVSRVGDGASDGVRNFRR